MRRSLPLLFFILSTLLLAACAPVLPTTAPTTTPVSTATATPPPTPTAMPATATAIPATATATAEPAYLGELTAAQREALDKAARAYISLTPEEALATAQELDYIGRNANPATMCGPLAIAILQDAGLVDPSFDLADFWYLNPRPGQNDSTLARVFPAGRYEKIEEPLPIDQVDYSANPLYPGDFLYLFAGDSGSFEHMLVVSRVDEAGRAYAVTNVNTTEGEVIIAEVMLYDPAEPGVGQFYEWTDWENRYIGRTGYGGYWLWRPLTTSP